MKVLGSKLLRIPRLFKFVTMLQIAVFSLANIALYASGQKTIVVSFFIVALIVVLLVYLKNILLRMKNMKTRNRGR